MPNMQLTRATFDRLATQIHRLCGVVVGPDKEYLVRDRLEPIVRRHGWRTFEELAERLPGATSNPLCVEVVEAIVTHETSFFRDPHVWEAIGQVVFPALLHARRSTQDPLRCWSAATSTGQEAYTLAMVFLEHAAGAAPEQCSILATDICPTAIRRGEQGEYESRELARGLSPGRKQRFFSPHGPHWRVVESARRMIDFRRLNLVEPLPPLGSFDLICCRNLLIYFDEPTRRTLCARLHALLRAGGWLVLGSAENLYGVSDGFESVVAGKALFYRKRSAN
jgi:chemotaxis protein methyltransferase CheR